MQYVPKNLYRYRPLKSSDSKKGYETKLLDRLCEGIDKRQLFAPRTESLNDPFEGIGIVPLGMSAGASIYMNLGFLPPKARGFTDGFRVVSMTERYDSPQMWAHYATGYCGVCMCFDTSFLEDKIDAVRYTDIPIVECEHRASDLISRREEAAQAALLVKQAAWFYEQEWRAILSDDDTQDGYISYGDGTLWAVIVGHKTPEDAKTVIRNTCLGAGVPLYITVPQELKYRIGIWPYGFQPTFDGDTIERELDEFRKTSGHEPFEILASNYRNGPRSA